MNRVKTILRPSGTQSTSNVYDAVGNLKSAASGISAWSANYNFRNMPTSETSNLNNGQFNWNIGYGYDAYGHLSSIQYPTGESVSYAPNPRGLNTMAGSYAGTIGYYADGVMQNATLGNGVTRLLDENTRLLPSTLTYSKGAAALVSEDYTYDKNANLTGVSDLVNGQNNQTLGYDAINRLTSGSAPNAWGVLALGYDPLNRVRTKTEAGYPFTYNYDATSRLSTITSNGSGFANYQYDTHGNRTQQNVVFTAQTLLYDDANQLLQVSGVETYAYDAAGRRVMKTPNAGGAASASYTFYNHAGELMYGYNAANGQSTNYIYLNGKLIARHAGNTVTYLLTDRLGTPVRETDVNGNVTASFSYRLNGGLFSGTNQGGPGFTGHENDPETSLTYMQARYYDAGVGGFLSVDPVTPTLGDVFNFNRYAYANDNPVTNVDPTGRCTGSLFCATSDAAGVIGNGYTTFVNSNDAAGGGNARAPGQITYQSKVPAATGQLDTVLKCMASTCPGSAITVTSTSEPTKVHKPDDPHLAGQAADLKASDNQQATRLLTCASNCGALYGKNEVIHPSSNATGPHVHIQTVPGLGPTHEHNGGRGDLPQPQVDPDGHAYDPTNPNGQ